MNIEFEPYDRKYRSSSSTEFINTYDVALKNNVLVRMEKNIRSLVLACTDKCCKKNKEEGEKKLLRIVANKIKKLFSSNTCECLTLKKLIADDELNFIGVTNENFGDSCLSCAGFS